MPMVPGNSHNCAGPLLAETETQDPSLKAAGALPNEYLKVKE